MKIVIASHNKGKIKEFKEILEDLGYEVMGVEALGCDVTQVVENGETFEENALLKAKYVYQQLKIPVLSDDSGLVLDAFPSMLGIHSARYMEDKSYLEKNQSIVDLYKNIENRKASFVSALVYYDGAAHSFLGKVDGKIAEEILGEEGFGYDPIFIPQGHKESFASMGPSKKARISHRGRAIEKFVTYLKEDK